MEDDGTRLDARAVLTAAGYACVRSEPAVQDAAVREAAGMTDYFLLFERDRS
jgi:hypothetical protein